MNTLTLDGLEDEMVRIVAEAERNRILLRLIGGLAVKAHCPVAGHRALERTYPDIDFVVDRRGGRFLLELLPRLGYTPNKMFNTLNGDRRQLYHDEMRGRQIDIFVGDFDMAHKIPLAGRLAVEPLTVPLAELYLSKAQIVELNRKDILDLLALLLDHEVGSSDRETINQDVIARLCALDWGLYTTVSLTAERVTVFLDSDEVSLSPHQKQLVRQRLARLQEALEAETKSLAWKVRSRVGKRLPWYQEVEEVQR